MRTMLFSDNSCYRLWTTHTWASSVVLWYFYSHTLITSADHPAYFRLSWTHRNFSFACFVGNNLSHNHVSWFHPYGHSQLGPSIFFSIQNMVIVSMVSFFTNRAPSHCQIRDSWVWSLRLAQRSESSMRWELDGVHHDASVYESVEIHWEVEWVTGETLIEVNCP